MTYSVKNIDSIIENNRLHNLYVKAVQIMHSIDLPINVSEIKIKFNNRLTNSFGRTEYDVFDKLYTIDINKKYFESSSDKDVLNMLLHELIHTLPNGMTHGKEFKNYIKRLHNIGYDIDVEQKQSDLNLNTDKMFETSNYVIRCTKCGHMVYFDRINDIIRNPSHYHHKEDGGVFELIKNKKPIKNKKLIN